MVASGAQRFTSTFSKGSSEASRAIQTRWANGQLVCVYSLIFGGAADMVESEPRGAALARTGVAVCQAAVEDTSEANASCSSIQRRPRHPPRTVMHQNSTGAIPRCFQGCGSRAGPGKPCTSKPHQNRTLRRQHRVSEALAAGSTRRRVTNGAVPRPRGKIKVAAHARVVSICAARKSAFSLP